MSDGGWVGCVGGWGGTLLIRRGCWQSYTLVTLLSPIVSEERQDAFDSGTGVMWRNSTKFFQECFLHLFFFFCCALVSVCVVLSLALLEASQAVKVCLIMVAA